MESRIQTVLERLEARSQQENSLLESLRSQGGSAIRDRAENLMLDVGPEVGLFLNLLVRSTRATAVIEIGGSVGYSTIWLAEAVRANGGRLYSFEVNSAKQQEQKENLEAARLLSVVELIDQEAIEVRDFQKINYSFSRIIIILGVWEVGIDGCPLLPIL
ncbi:O-methyltransferase [Microcystis aeruginosa]|uniref:O-methyltransferase n=1 Tax=Microcystis aeruginosa TaxID=1126 RepID=UPI00086A49DA|nr:class I SAM-dependent methyltransferase [Microcystis aeruginosa]ODV39796.1 O-methyltransferase [Microcystis aeruginosa NIES-98]